MLDHCGDKHQASATPCIISRLKTRHSDKKKQLQDKLLQTQTGVRKDLGLEEMKPKAKDVQIVSQAIKK